MKKRFGIILAIAVGVVGAGSYVAEANFMRAQPTKVAVVNVGEVMTSLAENKAVHARYQNSIDKLEVQRKGDQRKVNEMTKKMAKLYAPGSADYLRLEDERQAFVVTAKTKLQIAVSKADRYRFAEIRLLYINIVKNIESIAKAEGYDIVIQGANIKQMPINGKAFQAVTNNRTILYLSDKVNLTKTVIDAMNAKYKSGK